MPMLIDTAELAGLAAEGVLYGVFLCLFSVCGYDLVQRRKRFNTQISWPMVLSAVLLIALATTRFIIDCTNIFVAFIRHNPREARLAYLLDVTQPLFTTKHSLFITTLLVGDTFVNYRCWIVWGKNFWVVFAPIVLSIVSTASGAYTLWAYSHLPNQTIPSQANWLTVLFTLSLAANALATSLLAYRIWSVDWQVKNTLGKELAYESRLGPIVRIILESGLMNAAYLFVFVMMVEFGSQALEIMSEMAVPLTGIIFSIVILRVGQRRHGDSFYSTHRAATGTTLSWAVPRRCRAVPGVSNSETPAEARASVMSLEVFVSDGTTKTRDDQGHLEERSERESITGTSL